MVLHVVVALLYSFIALYLKASTLAVRSQMYIVNSLDLPRRYLRHC